MRHSVIENMFREQYCLRNSDQIDVQFISDINGISEFKIKDYQDVKGKITLRTSILQIGIVKQKIEVLNN